MKRILVLEGATDKIFADVAKKIGSMGEDDIFISKHDVKLYNLDEVTEIEGPERAAYLESVGIKLE